MIYETTRKPTFDDTIIRGPTFDDTIIRGVDGIVNGMYYNKTGFYAAHLPPIAYLNEFRIAFLSLPRQCGKTTYIKKLYSHMKNMGHRPLIVTRREIDVNESFGRDFEAKSVSRIRNPQTFLGKRHFYDIVLFDEVHPKEAKEVLEIIINYQNGVGSKIDFVLGLYT